MRTLLFYIALSLGALVQGQVLAQEADNKDVTEPTGISVKFNAEGESGSEDESEEKLSPDEQIERAVAVVRKLAGDDAADNMSLELNGLNDEEKEELVKEFTNGFRIGFDGMSAGEVLVAIVAILLSLGMPIIILFMVLIFGHRKRRQKMEVMKAFLDSDRDVPREVIAEFSGEDINNFRSGVKLVAIGLGIILALTLSGNSEPAAFGLIPLFIGVARLIFWKYDSNTGQA